MPAYFIARLQMRDPSWVDEYTPKVQALVEKHGGRYLMEVMEGTTPSSTVMAS